jgi:pyruvate,water dikinase
MSISSERFRTDSEIARPVPTDIAPESVALEFGEPLTLPLSHARVCDPAVAGNKAANLARASVAGLPTLPGFVVTTWGASEIRTGGSVAALPADKISLLKAAWEVLSFEGERSLVVRSSSSGEDMEGSSMAGRFISVLGIRSWPEFAEAVERVIASADIVHLDHQEGPVPIAVLVQPELECVSGGIMFGIDPIGGRTDRLVISAVAGGPDQLVSGRADGIQYTMAPSGRSVQGPRRGQPRILNFRQRLALARLADEARRTFGGAQDIEWAFDGDGKLWLFQSRPVTAVGVRAKGAGPLLGPGPVAETFPHQLSTLEEDLWVGPLATAVTSALAITGAAARKRIEASPVVTTVNGWAVADLDLFGTTTRKKTFFQRIDPRPPSRRLAAAWRVGRLRAALPLLSGDLAERVDEELAGIPSVRKPSNDELLQILKRSRQVLVSLHGHEVLSGLLSGVDDESATAAGEALRLLAAGRAAGLDDGEIVATYPEVLALVPPRIGREISLPPTPEIANTTSRGPLGPREALRLRIRWVHELIGAVAHELGWRLACAGYLSSADDIRNLSIDEVEKVMRLGDLAADLRSRERTPSPPPPSFFRLGPDGTPVAEVIRSKEGSARGAGGGRGAGPVHLGNDPRRGDVLVVKVLDPALATILPNLGGLISETGSVLSHLAILAREYGVPTVVGVAGATERYEEGAMVVVDGGTGEVAPVETP